jgi:ribosomal protein S18 acetylase RimI-like enzyme
MAAVTEEGLRVRAPLPGDGFELAGLWRELWDAHEAWGGYPGTRDEGVYAEVGRRLDEDARIRGGHPVLGRHVHLAACMRRRVVGQVEGWIERHGTHPATPTTCEVRSLIVNDAARGSGAGRALLDELERIAVHRSHGLRVVLAAEVLEANPARAFYERLGFFPAAYSHRMTCARASTLGEESQATARQAISKDAPMVAMLEVRLAERRRALGDVRFDRPRAIEAAFIDAIAMHLGARRGPHDAVELVAVDARGNVRASACVIVSSLDPPFIPTRRALCGRFGVDPVVDPGPYVRALVRAAGRIGVGQGAVMLELTDMDGPNGALSAAASKLGATPWSRVVERVSRA